jgi:hypothetical protein
MPNGPRSAATHTYERCSYALILADYSGCLASHFACRFVFLSSLAAGRLSNRPVRGGCAGPVPSGRDPLGEGGLTPDVGVGITLFIADPYVRIGAVTALNTKPRLGLPNLCSGLRLSVAAIICSGPILRAPTYSSIASHGQRAPLSPVASSQVGQSESARSDHTCPRRLAP